MSDEKVVQTWLKDHDIEDVGAFVTDMACTTRGKLIPADKFGSGELKLP